VLLVGLPSVRGPSKLLDEVLALGVGGVLLTDGNVETIGQVKALVAAIRAAAPHSVVVAADEEPGRVRTFRELFGNDRSARRMAREDTAEEVERIGRATGWRLVGLGVDVDLAPVADVDSGPSDAIVGDRSFSGDPLDASKYSLAYARGLAAGGVTPVIKHFPGHGRTRGDSHAVLPRVTVSLATLRSTDLVPFTHAVDAGAPVVMLGHVAYDAIDPGVPASMSPRAYALLRDLGFSGVALTDSIGMGAVNLRWDFDVAAVKALAAGADGVLATDGRQARRMRDAIVDAVLAGRLDEARLDEAAARMTALAGDDPEAVACTPARLPDLGNDPGRSGVEGRTVRAEGGDDPWRSSSTTPSSPPTTARRRPPSPPRYSASDHLRPSGPSWPSAPPTG